MTPDLQQQLNALHGLTPKQLRAKYHEVWGEPSRSGNARFLKKRIAWRIQANAEGDLPQRIRQKALTLARDSDLRTTAPGPGPRNGLRNDSRHDPQNSHSDTPGRTVERTFASSSTVTPELMPGSQLTRLYKNATVVVDVLEDGFAYQGQKYRSLTATAKAITNTHCSGHAFFGLNPRPRPRK